MATVDEFINVTPSTENYLRGVVLFGVNVASYKFALAKSIIELADGTRETISLDELAEPFSRHVSEHLRSSPRQATSSSSRFLEACRRFNEGDLDAEALRSATVRLGFNNVIDAFHVVGGTDIPVRFFIDERKTSINGIRVTPDAVTLATTGGAQALAEIEARWKLVETAWSLELAPSLIVYESDSGLLVPSIRRVSLTSARDALNGYQKGSCFYCFRPISTVPSRGELADVDHLFPHVLQRLGLVSNLDQVWNLVLACRTCNRGPSGKFDRTPDLDYVKRLYRRNEYLIASHHPLRDTLMNQTGSASQYRHAFLQEIYGKARTKQVAIWGTPAVADPAF